jgi:hypothetical protein
MPFAINEKVFQRQTTVNLRMPQEAVTDDATGTNTGGLPVKQIPHLEFPRVVYLHPNKPFWEKEHRNTNFEIVHIEKIPTEHESKLVNNQEELEQALAEGWVKEPYIAKPMPDPKAKIYARK